ncbi:hypothetical protein B0H14DRAFT_2640421 [Mycena olivaceomarginata]|nr:hypothetical protein B0H14DRAFT_2640421 [Mycena olivaceomarginata]
MLQVLFGAGAVFILLALQATTSPRIARAESRRVPCGVLAWRGTGRHPWPVPLLCVRWSWTDRMIILSCLTPIADGQCPVIGIFTATGMMVAATMRASLVPVCISPHNAAAGVADLLKKTSAAAPSSRSPHCSFKLSPLQAPSFKTMWTWKEYGGDVTALAKASCPPTRDVSVQPAQNSIRQPASRTNIGAPTVADDVCLVFMICNDCTSPRLAPGLKAKTVSYYVPVQAPFGNTKVTAAPLPLRMRHFAFWMPTLVRCRSDNDATSSTPRIRSFPATSLARSGTLIHETAGTRFILESPLAQSSTNYDLAVVDVELRVHLSICHGVNLHGVELAEHDWMRRHPMLPALRLCTSAAALHPHSVFVSTWRRECKALSVVVIGCTYLELDVSLHGPREK